MSDIASARNLISVEEMQTGSAAAENTMNRVGGSINLLLKAAPIILNWNANGPYSNGGAPQTYVDTERGLLDNLTLAGYYLFTEKAGSAGTLEVDVVRRTTGGSEASIFGTTPKIVFSAGNNARNMYDFRSSTSLWLSAGGTHGTAAITTFSAGDVLRMNIQQIQTSGRNFGLQLFFYMRS